MESIVYSSLLAMANVLGVAMIVPQVIRVWRATGMAAGLSGVWVGVGIAMNGWWLAYATQSQLFGLIPVSVGAGGLYLAIAALLLRWASSSSLRPLALGVLGVGVFPVPFLLGGGWTAAGVAVGFSYGVQFVPAAVTAVRSADVSGIAGTTWAMGLVEALIWFGYGLSMGDAALVVGGAGASAAAGIILVRLFAGYGFGPPRNQPAITIAAQDAG